MTCSLVGVYERFEGISASVFKVEIKFCVMTARSPSGVVTKTTTKRWAPWQPRISCRSRIWLADRWQGRLAVISGGNIRHKLSLPKIAWRRQVGTWARCQCMAAIGHGRYPWPQFRTTTRYVPETLFYCLCFIRYLNCIVVYVCLSHWITFEPKDGFWRMHEK
jgi:hypothetical protein